MPQYNKSKNSYVKDFSDCSASIKAVIHFLQLFIPETTARKLVCVILIAVGMPVVGIAELVGVSERNVQSTGRAIKDGSISSVLVHKKTSGRKSKTAGVEEQILAELENGDYHSRQQIADMLKEKFQITVSLSAVGRFLKKRFQETQMRIAPRES